MTQPLRDSAGKVVGACDEGIPMFDRLGRRPWRPRARPAPRVAADREITVEIDGPTMASQIKGYNRL